MDMNMENEEESEISREYLLELERKQTSRII